MEDYFKKISHTLKSLSLTERERTLMRLDLAAFIDEHPARAPLSVRAMGQLSRFSYFSGAFASRHAAFGYRVIASALVLVLAAGVGTTYAAEASLPGDPLYGIKVNVAEPVERALTASSQSQAQWDVTLANRRLDEAEKLAAAGKLTAENAQVVEQQLNVETQNLDESVASSAASSTVAANVSEAPSASSTPESTAPSASSTVQVVQVAQAADAQSDLEASLAAHAQILSAIASSSPSVGQEIAPLLAIVRTHAATARTARLAALAALDASGTTTLRLAASGEMQDAESGLTSIRALLVNADASADASTSAQIDTDASDTAQTIHAGDSSLAHGRFKAALSAFQAAMQTAKQVQVDAQAQANLGTSVVLPPLPAAIDATTSSDADTSSEAGTSTDDTQNTIEERTGALPSILGQ